MKGKCIVSIITILKIVCIVWNEVLIKILKINLRVFLRECRAKGRPTLADE